MIRELRWILSFLGYNQGREVHYIGGSDVLPPPLKGKQEQEILERLENGDDAAKQTLIEHNLRLVVFISRRFENTGVNLEDLISIGTIGLIKAIGTIAGTGISNWLPMPPGVLKMRFSCIFAKLRDEKRRFHWMNPSIWTETETKCGCQTSWVPMKMW